MLIWLARRMWLCSWIAVLLSLCAPAQTLDAARFPSVDRVLSEAGDDAEHYATLKVLSEAAQQAGPTGQLLFGAYYNALNDIDFRLRGGDPAAYASFTASVQQRLGPGDFRDRVRNRYGLNGATHAPAREGDELDRAIAASVPHWIAALLVLLLASPLLVFLLDRRDLAGASNPHDSLPAELRTVRVLGRSYAVEARTGTVVEKETLVEQRLHVHTSGGGATVVGDQVSVAPTQVHAHTEITRKDCLWVRDASGRESAWNFTNAALQARPGHHVSALARPAADGGVEFLLAYNHATGQLDTFAGLARAHQPRRLLAWIATSVVGAAMVLLAMRALVTSSGESVPLSAMFQLGNWPAPLGVAAACAAITVPISAALLRGLRTRAFMTRCAPAYRKHFEALRTA